MGGASGPAAGGVGWGGAADPAGRATPRAGAARGAVLCGAVRRVWLRSARLPAGRGDHMSSRPVGARSSPAAPCLLRTALTMSVCCCFFFRDYGSSRRKSGKGVSGVCRLLRARLHPAWPFWGACPCGSPSLPPPACLYPLLRHFPLPARRLSPMGCDWLHAEFWGWLVSGLEPPGW